jgi:hypothetical protein
MRSHPLYTCLSISSIFSLSTAWPLILGQHERREPASYSVVAVDGGNSGGDGSATTVTNSIVHTETILKTQLSTIVITESDTPSTIVVTITSASPATVTAPSLSTQTITSAAQTTAEPGQSQDSSLPAPETVTVTQPLPSSKAYDDGMWHTHYYYTVSEETTTSSSLPSSTSEVTDALPSTTRGSNWWGGPGPEIISTSLEPTFTTTSAEWASFWRAPVSDSPSVTTSSPSVAAPTVGVPFWGGPPNFATTSTS